MWLILYFYWTVLNKSQEVLHTGYQLENPYHTGGGAVTEEDQVTQREWRV